LEELKIENSRLQHLVDMLDSQPELIFCINALGDITYASEKTINFMLVTHLTDCDDDPTHVSQILVPESVTSLLTNINEMMLTPISNSEDSSMLFSAKEVSFHDAFGNPMMGFLRCAKVHRRTAFQELLEEEEPKEPAAKKMKGRDTMSDTMPMPPMSSAPSSSSAPTHTLPHAPHASIDLTNFKMLTDCVSSLADRDLHNTHNTHGMLALPSASSASVSMGVPTDCTVASGDSGCTSNGTGSPNMQTQGQVEDADFPYEFVCVIRTAEAHFPQYLPSRNNTCNSGTSGSSTGSKGTGSTGHAFFTFSSQLSTACVEEHDRNNSSTLSHSSTSQESRSLEDKLSSNKSAGSGSGGSSGGRGKNNSTSSETGSDNTGETD
jgi:hypothetical protein